MKLIIHELDGNILEQTVTPGQNTIVSAIRPHIYRHNFPTGSLKLEIRDASNVLLATSETVNISDIAILDYYHGYVRFYVNAYLKRDQQYKIRLVGGDGYSFSESAYIGWVNGHDLSKYPVVGFQASTYNAPLDLEIWERTVK